MYKWIVLKTERHPRSTSQKGLIQSIPLPYGPHLDHKGPLNRTRKHHSLNIVGSFCFIQVYLQVYPVRSTDDVDTIKA